MGYPALIGMTDFSHVWLVFVFHDNTNATVNGVVEERTVNGGSTAGEAKRAPERSTEGEGEEGAGGDEDEERWGGGAREYRTPKHKLRQTFLTKVW